jgi:hypothetical protein
VLVLVVGVPAAGWWWHQAAAMAERQQAERREQALQAQLERERRDARQRQEVAQRELAQAEALVAEVLQQGATKDAEQQQRIVELEQQLARIGGAVAEAVPPRRPDGGGAGRRAVGGAAGDARGGGHAAAAGTQPRPAAAAPQPRCTYCGQPMPTDGRRRRALPLRRLTPHSPAAAASGPRKPRSHGHPAPATSLFVCPRRRYARWRWWAVRLTRARAWWVAGCAHGRGFESQGASLEATVRCEI